MSFYDFDDEEKLVGENINFNDDTSMGSSEFLSVDEGAIAILSMDEIRNMKKLEMDYKIEDLETR